MKKILLALLLLVLLFAGALFFVPWNKVLEGRVIALLQSKGFNDVTLSIDKVSFTQAELSNVTIGGDAPLSLQSVTLNYTVEELLNGTLDDVSLTGVAIQLTQTDEGWQVGGLPVTSASDKPFVLSDTVNALPFSHLNITNSTIAISGKTISGTIPFALSLKKGEQIEIDVATQPATLRAAESDILVGALSANARPSADNNWSGNWSVTSLDLNDVTPMPALAGGGTLSLDNNILAMAGNLDSADKTYRGAFGLTIDPQKPDANKATVTAASFPFKEGRLSTRNVTIPFSGNAPIRANVEVQQVSVDALLQTLTGSRVTATGTFSGAVPLVVSRDGTYSLGKGELKADGAGSIQMSGDAIPGNNPQVGLVRDILANLQYSLLSVRVENSANNQMTVRLSVEGKNPDVMDGKPVKLNINLTGDILDFIQQNIMLISNPERLLKQGAHE